MDAADDDNSKKDDDDDFDWIFNVYICVRKGPPYGLVNTYDEKRQKDDVRQIELLREKKEI